MPTLAAGTRIAKKTPEHAHDKRGHGTDDFAICAEYKTLIIALQLTISPLYPPAISLNIAFAASCGPLDS